MLRSIICTKSAFIVYSSDSIFPEVDLDFYFSLVKEYFIEKGLLTIADYAFYNENYGYKIKDISQISWFPKAKLEFLLEAYKKHIVEDYNNIYDWFCNFFGKPYKDMYLNTDFVVSILLQYNCIDISEYYDNILADDVYYESNIFSDGTIDDVMCAGYNYESERYYIFKIEE